MSDPRPKVIAIVGLTGTGKTDLAAHLARRIGAEIISADSMQVYREMDIGTAKPSPELRAEIPHHLIDVLSPREQMSAGLFAERAREAARDAFHRGRPVLLCGGTGLYARAFAGGLAPDLTPDPAVRAELRARTVAELYAELQRDDPDSARQINPEDRVRIERALEGLRVTGKPVSQLRAEHAFGDRPFQMRWFGLDRERIALWRALEIRVDHMLSAGWIDEVEGLRERYGRDTRALQAIGYRELGEVLDGQLDRGSARDRIVEKTRRYAKRQRTWFRAEPELEWLDADRPDTALERVLRTAGQ